MTFFSNYINLVLIAIVLISGGMLLWPALRKGGRGGVSTGEATQLINRRNAVVVDLRSADEFANGHLPAARNLPFGEFEAKIGQFVKNRNNPLLLVCQSGQQSHKAQRAAKEAGFAEVHVLDGGVNAWQKAGMPVVKQGGSK